MPLQLIVGAFYFMDEKETYVYNYLIEKGLTPAQAAGIVGNLKAESNFNTTVKGKADNKGSQGIAQWHSERKTGLFNFAKSQKKDWENLDTQLDYLLHELNTTHKRAFEKLKKTKTPDEAALVFMNEFEKPAKWAKKQSTQLRINTARNVMGLEVDPNFAYNKDKEYQDNISDIVTELPQVSGIVFSGDKEEKTEGEKAAQQLNEENFIEDYNDFQQQNQLQQEVQAPIQEQEMVTPLEVTPIEYSPPQIPQQSYQDGGKIPVSSDGLYKHPNQTVLVPTQNGEITMSNINYPVLGTDEFGNSQMMYPNQNYQFQGKTILEIPQFKK